MDSPTAVDYIGPELLAELALLVLVLSADDLDFSNRDLGRFLIDERGCWARIAWIDGEIVEIEGGIQ